MVEKLRTYSIFIYMNIVRILRVKPKKYFNCEFFVIFFEYFKIINSCDL